ncbi:potassium channel family protein [Taibaiella soli]|uniref:Potassium channel domain-containing protein n=1 Tax=Taibaiella soli TaxID=1649169 RepID=A0A2W2BBM7_9BACT|nr:potassium channel family protein [Taibaiella soli]PZF71056.1 hypothetical protein DN068_20375 [Taibaiella soli]
MNLFEKKVLSFWDRENSLTILLIVLAIQIFIVIPFGQQTFFGRAIFYVFYILLMVTGMLVLMKNNRLRATTFVLLILAVVALFGTNPSFEIAHDLITAFFCLLLNWVVLLRTFGKGPVTTHRIFGAIVAYLLIALIFALLYHTVYIIKGEISFKGLGTADRKEFLYFSFVTLTSIGYGDISPVVPFLRSLANLEGLVGQLYPGIIIARLVSMEFESSRRKKENNDRLA